MDKQKTKLASFWDCQENPIVGGIRCGAHELGARHALGAALLRVDAPRHHVRILGAAVSARRLQHLLRAHPDALDLGFGRIVASEKEVPNNYVSEHICMEQS
jgi:hypothetical protein